MKNPEKHFVRLQEMQLSRYGPSKTIINFFIEGAGHGKRPDLARDVYEMMGRIGVAPNLDSDIVMLQCYLRNDRIADAVNFFHDCRRQKFFDESEDATCKKWTNHKVPRVTLTLVDPLSQN